MRGAVTASAASGEFYTALNDEGSAVKKWSDDEKALEDFRVIHTRGVTGDDAFSQWSAELNQAGHAIITTRSW